MTVVTQDKAVTPTAVIMNGKLVVCLQDNSSERCTIIRIHSGNSNDK